MAPHSSTLAWKIPWMEEPGRLQSVGSHRVFSTKCCLKCYLPTTAAAAKLLQSCPTLCNPIDGSPPGSSIHGIFQARVLEWVPLPSPPVMIKENILLCKLIFNFISSSFQERILILFMKMPFWVQVKHKKPDPSFRN